MTGESVSGKLVVIGGGQAAFALVAKLRALKDERPITIVASEASLPYQRPPLSKKYLLREMSLDRLLYRAEAWYGEHDVDIRLSTTVTDLDRDASRVMLSDGTSLDYETLAFATGATPVGCQPRSAAISTAFSPSATSGMPICWLKR